MTYRIFTESVLDEVADFTLKLAIPESSYNVKNADGTAPVVTLKVNASTKRFALAALREINTTQEMLNIIAQHRLGADFATLVVKKPKKATKLMEKIDPKFYEFYFKATQDEADGGGEIEVTLTAPSGLIGFKAFQAMTNPQKLSGLLASFMPDEDEDDFDDYDTDEDYDN